MTARRRSAQVEDFNAAPPPLTALLWDVLLTDLCARSFLMLFKTLVACAVPAAWSRSNDLWVSAALPCPCLLSR